mgnify:CR=1 FL=1
MSGRLEGKKIIVTAAGQGIGKATATIFAKNNIRLILCGRRIVKLK